eukprot:2577085-Prymnesium_polylepis.1
MFSAPPPSPWVQCSPAPALAPDAVQSGRALVRVAALGLSVWSIGSRHSRLHGHAFCGEL